MRLSIQRLCSRLQQDEETLLLNKSRVAGLHRDDVGAGRHGLFAGTLGAGEECRMNCVRRSRYGEIIALMTARQRQCCDASLLSDLRSCWHHVTFNVDQFPLRHGDRRHLSFTPHQLLLLLLSVDDSACMIPSADLVLLSVQQDLRETRLRNFTHLHISSVCPSQRIHNLKNIG